MKQEIKNSAKRRLAILGGQVRGIQEMVENEKYCVDIITQIEAVREALSGVKNIILENHISTHVLEQMKHGEDKKATKEILKIYRLAQK
jgi:DNA-binding FrmR family transcriptional regulator